MSHPSRLCAWPSGSILLLLLPSLAAFPLAAQEAGNPFTGQPLSLERMHWALEQARLDEQLQASLLNRRKFELERARLDGGAAGSDPLVATESALRPGSPLSLAAPAGPALAPVGSAAASPAAGVAKPGALPRVTRRARPKVPDAAAGLQVVGVRSQGSDWCLLVLEADGLRPVCPGEWRRGHHVESVTATAYRLDGASHVLEIPVPQLRQADRAMPLLSEPPRPVPAEDQDMALMPSADPLAEPGPATLGSTISGPGTGAALHLAPTARSARP